MSIEDKQWTAITTVNGQEYKIPVSGKDQVDAICTAAKRFKQLFKKGIEIPNDWTIQIKSE